MQWCNGFLHVRLIKHFRVAACILRFEIWCPKGIQTFAQNWSGNLSKINVPGPGLNEIGECDQSKEICFYIYRSIHIFTLKWSRNHTCRVYCLRIVSIHTCKVAHIQLKQPKFNDAFTFNKTQGCCQAVLEYVDLLAKIKLEL